MGMVVPFKCISCTIVRKTVITHSREVDFTPDQEQEMADAMSHDLSTAKAYYAKDRAKRKAVKTTIAVNRSLAALTHADDDDDDDDEEEEDIDATSMQPRPESEMVMDNMLKSVVKLYTIGGLKPAEQAHLMECLDEYMRAAARKSRQHSKQDMVEFIQGSDKMYHYLLNKNVNKISSKIRHLINRLIVALGNK